MNTLSVAGLLAEARSRVAMLAMADAPERLTDPRYVFIDVRELHEVSTGMIPGARHAPRSNLEWLLDSSLDRHEQLFPQGKTFVFVCGSGGRASLSARLASEFGLQAMWLEGGMKAWRAAGRPVTGESTGQPEF
jgi:rhodanese-related sulfurtransferase